jgi:hypothetical protein
MNEELIFDQFAMWRNWTIASAETLSLDLVDKVPSGFSNNIRWNMGHILGWDHGIYQNLCQERKLSLKYHLMFSNGSKPSNWEEEPPSFVEILENLKIQQEHLIDASRGKLDTPLDKPFLHMTTLGEMFLFQISHESLHMGYISSIKRSVEG